MFNSISVSLNPIGPWALLAAVSLTVLVLTLWAYSRKIQGASGSWRWLALSLRLMALLLCLVAALRPSVIIQEKKRQPATIVFMLDSSKSMLFADEVREQTRWAVGKKAFEEAVETAKAIDPNLKVEAYRFDSSLHESKPAEGPADTETGTDKEAKEGPADTDKGAREDLPEGADTQLGTAMLEVEKRASQNNERIALVGIFSDFASNNGLNPLVAARRYRDQQIPAVTIGLGTENTSGRQKDLSVKDITAAPTVFVKNKLQVRGTLVAHGFSGRTADVELLVEGQAEPVAKAQIKIPEGTDTVPITGLEYNPQMPGEKLLTLKVTPVEGEYVASNNEQSTFVTVLSGGLNVFFLQGPNFTWDYKYLMNSIMSSESIQVDTQVIKGPAKGENGEVNDADFEPGKYNAYVLSDLPASFLAPHQQKLLADAVRKGAGFMMLGGRTSFGAGGWANTAVAEILPMEIHPNDGQLEPQGGVKFVPSAQGLIDAVLQIGANRTETARLWEMMPPILGTNRFGEPKRSANIIAETGTTPPEPLMISMDGPEAGRVLAYGGDTWVWARASEEGRMAHRKFWRQAIFWLSHKDDQGDNQVKLTLDRRRISMGEKVEMSVTAQDAKGMPIKGLTYETKVEREGPDPSSEPIDLYTQGDEAKGSYPATGAPGVHRVTVVAKRGAEEIGRDTSRFLVYQDDRELENPSADLELARQIAEITSGEAIAHEALGKYLKSIDRSAYTESLSPTEKKVWDNWPFLLIFATLLTLEWFIRKRHGWV